MKFKKRIKHQAVYWLLLGLKQLVLWIPFRLAKKIAEILAILGYYLVKKNRNRILYNLKHIYNSKLTDPELRKLAKATYKHWAKCVIELLSIPKFSTEKLNRLIRIEGQDNLDAARQRNQGLVCVLAHYGNWELVGAYYAKVYHEPISVVGNELYDRKLDRLLNQIREQAGLNILNRGNALKASLAAIRKKEVLAIMADYDGGGETVQLPFFESTIPFPTAPLYFAYRSGAPVLPVFIIRQPDDTHCIYIEKPLTIGKEKDISTDFRNFIAEFVGLIETYINRAPTQWVWME
ncbi:MAG: lysophospholipid acyltransferase family protein [bacterium]